MQFARESYGICRFCGSCMREYDLIYPDAMGAYIWAWLNYAYVKFVM